LYLPVLTDCAEKFDADEDRREVIPACAIDHVAVTIEQLTTDKHRFEQVVEEDDIGQVDAAVIDCAYDISNKYILFLLENTERASVSISELA